MSRLKAAIGAVLVVVVVIALAFHKHLHFRQILGCGTSETP